MMCMSSRERNSYIHLHVLNYDILQPRDMVPLANLFNKENYPSERTFVEQPIELCWMCNQFFIDDFSLHLDTQKHKTMAYKARNLLAEID